MNWVFTLLGTFFLTLQVRGSEVIELTDKDFRKQIRVHDSAMVMFHAPWCGHCKKLKPIFEEAATNLAARDSTAKMIKVDCSDAGEKTCQEYDVKGYPTLKHFRRGHARKDYDGSREAEDIVKFMLKTVEPAAREVTSQKELEEWLDEEKVNVIGHFKEESELRDTFLRVAEKLRDTVRFAVCSTMSLGSEEGVSLHRIKRYENKFEPTVEEYKGPNCFEILESWVRQAKYGLVGHRQADNTADFSEPLVVTYYHMNYARNPKGTSYWRNRVLKVAQAFSKDFTFAVSDISEFDVELKQQGLPYSWAEKPLVFARKGGQRYFMKETFSVSALDFFLLALKEDRLEPYIKTEQPVKDDELVKVAVATDFAEKVSRNGRDTLISFGAPWCGFCHRLDPVLKDLATALRDEDVDIVKMNGADNDVPPPYTLTGYPTIYWSPKNAKSAPVQYKGGRTLEDFIKFIAANANKELNKYDRKGVSKVKEEL